MKRALISRPEGNRICDVVEQGKEFEVTSDFFWMDCPDEVDTTYTVDKNGVFHPFNPLTQPGFAENAYKVARSIAYKGVGEQLDMIYREVMANGTISADGDWASHITSVKTDIPKDDPAAVLEWNRKYVEEMIAKQNQI